MIRYALWGACAERMRLRKRPTGPSVHGTAMALCGRPGRLPAQNFAGRRQSTVFALDETHFSVFRAFDDFSGFGGLEARKMEKWVSGRCALSGLDVSANLTRTDQDLLGLAVHSFFLPVRFCSWCLANSDCGINPTAWSVDLRSPPEGLRCKALSNSPARCSARMLMRMVRYCCGRYGSVWEGRLCRTFGSGIF